MQCDNHCLPFPITVEAWTPSAEILINPSSKMALTFSSMVVDTGLFVFQDLSTSLSNRLKFIAVEMRLCKNKKKDTTCKICKSG